MKNSKLIVKRVLKEGWKSFVIKPHRAYASIGVGRFNSDDKKLETKVSKYLEKNKQFPGFVCRTIN